jgi:hypothetical protein
MEYGQTAHNRTVSARPFGAGLQKTAVGLTAFVRFFSATFFCARETAARFLFSGAKKRQIQPERYATYRLKFILNIELKMVDKINKKT